MLMLSTMALIWSLLLLCRLDAGENSPRARRFPQRWNVGVQILLVRFTDVLLVAVTVILLAIGIQELF